MTLAQEIDRLLAGNETEDHRGFRLAADLLLRCKSALEQSERDALERPTLNVGDIVVADPSSPLRSGCSAYSCAVVVCSAPLTLVSESGDMVWRATVSDLTLTVAGKSDPAVLRVCMSRFLADYERAAAIDRSLAGK